MAEQLYMFNGIYVLNEGVYRVDTQDDLDRILTDKPNNREPQMGDRARVIEDGTVWMLNSNLEWKQQPTGSSGSGSGVTFSDLTDVTKEGM